MTGFQSKKIAASDKLKEIYEDPRHALLSEISRVLDSSRVWGGQGWVYHPIHPFKYLPLREKIDQELRTIAMEHGYYDNDGEFL